MTHSRAPRNATSASLGDRGPISGRQRNRPSTVALRSGLTKHVPVTQGHGKRPALDLYDVSVTTGSAISGGQVSWETSRAPRSRTTRKHKRRGWPPCPRTTLSLSHTATGLTIKAYCKVLTCYSCIVPRAIRRAEAIALAKPKQWVTLTRAGAHWDEVHRRMKLFRLRLARLGVRGDYCYHVEPDTSGEDSHVHLWWHGDRLRPGDVRTAAQSAHLGTHVALDRAFTAVEAYARPTIEYGLKMILRERPDEPTELWPAAQTYLDLNGQRLTHTTANFWRDDEGNGCSLVEAERAAHGRNQPAGDWRWVEA